MALSHNFSEITTNCEPSNTRILLVDDEKDILEILSYNLKKEGYKVFTAQNGIQALEEAIKINPHLIVLDVMMPEMDGVEACKKLRKIPRIKESMIAFLTARSEDFSESSCLEAGGDDFIKKPVRPSIFLSHVEALLKRYFLKASF